MAKPLYAHEHTCPIYVKKKAFMEAPEKVIVLDVNV